MSNQQFCKFFRNGLVYNNDTTSFTVSPCCYYKTNSHLTPNAELELQYQHIRDQWQSDDTNIQCERCLQMEKSGMTSYRQTANTTCDGVTDNIEFLTVAVNKQCNLACASCSASSSSFWYQENLRNNVPVTQEIINLHREDRNQIITKKFVDLLKKQNLTHLKYIKFGGGEPLMSTTHELIMEMIPCPENVTVHYTSNFSIMPSDRVMTLWKKFKMVKWVASVDGIHDQFEILRWPYRWEKFVKFQQTAWQTVPDNVLFGVEHTLNPLNIYYFDHFETWFNDVFAHNRYGDPSDLNLHPCWGPMGLNQTPTALREKIFEKYGPNHRISNLLKNHPLSGTVPQITAHMNLLDQQRGTQWRKTFKTVESYFND